MEKYWVSVIIQNKDDKRAWLCAMSNCEMSLESAMETINKAKARFVVLSAWVDTFDKNNEKHTVFHECYIDAFGNFKGGTEMKRYLLYVTFYAGSDDNEDTDRDLFVLTVDKEYTEEEMVETFRKVNWLLDPYAEEEKEFPITYEQGLNINTLMEGVGIYTKGKVEEVYSNCGQIEKVDNCYVIEQWQ